MEWLLRILGVLGAIFLVIVVLILVAILAFRRKLKNAMEGLSDLKYSVVPRRLHLVPVDHVEWRDPERARAETSQLTALGFQPAGSYNVEEMDFLRIEAFARPGDYLYAAVYEHDKVGIWTDLICRYQDETSLTLTNNREGSEMDQRPGHGTIYDPGASVERIYQRMLQERPNRAMRSVSAADFKPVFEKAYADGMDWRNSRGGATEDEIRAIMAAAGQEPDEETIAQIRKAKESEAFSNMQETLREKYLEQTALSAAEWERIRDRLLFIYDGPSPDLIAEMFLSSREDADEEFDYDAELEQARATVAQAGSARTGFTALVAPLTGDRAYERIGTVSGPVVADVWVQPEPEFDVEDE